MARDGPKVQSVEVLARCDDEIRGWFVYRNYRGASTYYYERQEGLNGRTRVYRVKKVAGDDGRNSGAEYYVQVAINGNEALHSCECWGNLRHGHCRHVYSLTTLEREGKL